MIDIHQQQQFKKLCAAYMEWCSLHATFKKLSAAYMQCKTTETFRITNANFRGFGPTHYCLLRR